MLYSFAYIFGFIISYAGWHMKFPVILILFPLLLTLNHSRKQQYITLFIYYATALLPLLYGAINFYSGDLRVIIFWLIYVSLLPVSWLFLKISPKENPKRTNLKLTIGLAITTLLPPFSIVSLGNPLLAAGEYYPGLKTAGYALYWVLSLFLSQLIIQAVQKRNIKQLMFAPILLISISIIINVINKPADLTTSIDPINTSFGKIPTDFKESYKIQKEIQYLIINRLAKKPKLMILPESLVLKYTEPEKALWRETAQLLQENGSKALLGVFKSHSKDGYDNSIELLGGNDESLTARLPMPVGNWRPWAGQYSARLHLDNNNVLKLNNENILVLFCYESMLVWPYWTNEKISAVIVVSNLWWAKETNIKSIMNETIRMQSRLFGVRYFQAVNE